MSFDACSACSNCSKLNNGNWLGSPPLLVARWAHSRLQLDEQFATYPNVKNMKRMKITTSYLFIDTEFCLQSFDGAYFKWMYTNNVNKSADLISSCFFRASRQEFFNNA